MVMDLLRGEDMGNLRDRTRAKAFDAIKQRNKEEKEAKQDASNVNNSLSQSSLPIIATTTPDASISTPRNSDKKISSSSSSKNKYIDHHQAAAGAIPLSICAYFAIEMLRCLKAVHTHGIVHRDVKGSNFVRIHPNSCSFKIIDFVEISKFSIENLSLNNDLNEI